ncbi:crotonobetaine/carnitine-CoA ligase [Mycobacterium frederiksbergense]|uniref:Crotonobetaine/carnitine-CoA ligase n=1 Tax=Mycolicibacterium frederiksbergense TaxID=117567 RepID=A0ABT6L576_9MYCO|nr:AMP-binding protein [Mycolicibacterium frederiksbergense]MDH6198102.1 crotonobetaine/carnitine-CoA ligase [Mycolicibacterium frederiksbergense]
MTPGQSVAELVERRAQADPDGELIRRAGGPALTAGALFERAVQFAGCLASVVGPGGTVATAVPSGPEAAALTTAISWLGAVELPVPVGLDPALARTLARSAGCATTVAVPDRLDLEPHLLDLGHHPRRPLLTIAGRRAGLPGIDELTAAPAPRRRPTLEEPTAVMITSGTGGRPKGALLPNGAAVGQAQRVRRAMAYQADDVLFNVFPWQHINARHAAFLPAVLSGARLVVDCFSARRFWRTAVEERVTAFNFMGSLCVMLLGQPASAADRTHRVRQAYGGPAPAWLYQAVRDRFGVELRQAYACTELADVATTGRQVRPGAAGRVVPEYELRIVDDDGAPVADGNIGTVVVRPRRRWLTFTEYVGDPEATRAAWREGWFVTGDRGRLDDGWFHHEGRVDDVIRRRGVTIDAEHLERVALSHADVEEAAAVGVPSELTEDEVLLVVVPRPGVRPDPAALRRHCAEHLPRHAVPRFVSVENALPRTGSFKIARRALRERGLPPTAWDGDAPATPQETP